MGRGLFETMPVFRQAILRCDEILKGEMDRSLLSVLYPRTDLIPRSIKPATRNQCYSRLNTQWQS